MTPASAETTLPALDAPEKIATSSVSNPPLGRDSGLKRGLGPLSSAELALVQALGTSSVAPAQTRTPRPPRPRTAPPPAPWSRTAARSAKDALQSLVSSYGLGRTGRDTVVTVGGVLLESIQDPERWLNVAPELLARPQISTRTAVGQHARALRGQVSLAARSVDPKLTGGLSLVGRSDDRSLGVAGGLGGRTGPTGFSLGLAVNRFGRSRSSTRESSRTRWGLGSRLELGQPGRGLYATADLLVLHERADDVLDPETGRRGSDGNRTGLVASLTTGVGSPAEGARLTLGYERQRVLTDSEEAPDEGDAFSARMTGGFTVGRSLRLWGRGHFGRADTYLRSRRPGVVTRDRETWTRYEGTAGAVLERGRLEIQVAVVVSHQVLDGQTTVEQTDLLPQGELRVRLTSAWTAWVHGARSLRVPGPYARAAFVVPQAAEPERGFVASLGTEVDYPDVSLALEVFSAWLSDAIVSQRTPERGLGQTDLQAMGAQAQLRWHLADDLSIRAIAAWTEGVSTARHATSGFLPAVHVFAALRWKLGPRRAYLEVYARGRTGPIELRSEDDDRFFARGTDANLRLGARGGLELGAGVSFYAAVENALDSGPEEEAPWWPQAGVDFRLGLSFSY